MQEDEIKYAYIAVADAIEERIRSGELARGTQLRVRGGLAEEYGRSEGTIRKAIAELERRGMVTVLRSSGTYVSWRP